MAEVVFRGRVFSVERRVVDGRVVEYVNHPGAVLIIPVLPDGRLVMIDQYRPVVGRRVVEFPAGTLEPGERPEECALRELEEETGYRADRLELLGRIFSSPGYSNEVIWVFRARGLVKTGQRLEEDEDIRVVEIGYEEAWELLSKEGYMDSKTLAALALHGRRQPR